MVRTLRHGRAPARGVAALALALLVACDAAPPTTVSTHPPPVAHTEATSAGTPLTIHQKLERRVPLTPAEVDSLRGVSAEPTLVRLLTNPGTPPEMLRSFAVHPTDAVRIAVASNPRTPVDVLVSLRAAGVGQPINRALAMNPSTPVDLLRDMRAKGEAGDVSLASNPSLPVDLMEDAHRRGDELVRLNLARNPATPKRLLDTLAQDESPAVREAAARPHGR